MHATWYGDPLAVVTWQRNSASNRYFVAFYAYADWSGTKIPSTWRNKVHVYTHFGGSYEGTKHIVALSAGGLWSGTSAGNAFALSIDAIDTNSATFTLTLPNAGCTPSATTSPTLSPLSLPTPPPTPSPPSATESPTRSPLSLPTPPPTPSPPSATTSPTLSPISLPTPPTLTPAPSPSPTPSPTLSPTPSPTLSPTPSPTPNPTLSPTPSPTPSPTSAPSFSPAVAGAVPKIAVALEGDPTSLTGPELNALEQCFLDKLEATGVVSFGDRSSIVVELTPGTSTFIFDAFFRPGSGVTIADAHAIVAAIQAGSGGSSHFVTCDDCTMQYPIAGASAEHEVPSPTSSPTPPTACSNYRWDSAGLPLAATDTSACSGGICGKGLKGKGNKYKKEKGKGSSDLPLPAVPIHLFTNTIAGCPQIDSSVYAGAGQHPRHAHDHACGFNGRTFNCDFWNLTRACAGSEAGEAGSEAMIAVCDELCDQVGRCDGSMLDHSYDENSGLCTLHTGTPTLTEACFFYSSANSIIDEANCAASYGGGLSYNPFGKYAGGVRYGDGGAIWKGGKTKGNGGYSGHSPGDGACERGDTPHGKTHGKNKHANGRKKKKKNKYTNGGKKKKSKGKSKSDYTSADAGAVDKIGIGGTVIVVAGGTVVLIVAVLAIVWFKKQLAMRAANLRQDNLSQDVIINPTSDPVERSTI